MNAKRSAGSWQPRDLTREGSLGLRVGEWGAACRSGLLEAAQDTCQRGLQGSRCRQTWPSRSAQGVPPPCCKRWETAFFTAHPALLLKEAAAHCLPVFPPDTGAPGVQPEGHPLPVPPSSTGHSRTTGPLPGCFSRQLPAATRPSESLAGTTPRFFPSRGGGQGQLPWNASSAPSIPTPPSAPHPTATGSAFKVVSYPP